MKPATVCPYCGAAIGSKDYGCRVCGFRHRSGRPSAAQAYCLIGSLGGLAVTSINAFRAFTTPGGNQLGDGTIALLQSVIHLLASIWLILALIARSAISRARTGKAYGHRPG